MKSSLYNIFYPLDDKIIAYNSVTDKYLVLEPLLHQLLEASIIENNIIELKDVHEDFFDILIKNGFIIEDNINELDEIIKISNNTDFNDENYSLTINSTMNCNFKCWYCYETHIKDSKLEKDTSDKIANFVENLFSNNKKIKNLDVQWFGGEPLLYFNKSILPLISKIFNTCQKYSINLTNGFTTNALLINQDLLDECKKYNVNHFQITLDGHRDRHNKVRFVSKTKGSYDEIVNNIKLCLENKFHVTARINISEETVTELLNIIEDFKDLSLIDKSYLNFSFHEVWQEEKDLTFDITNFVNKFRENKFKCSSKSDNLAGIYNSCYADKYNQAVFNYNGEVFKCTARDFKSNEKEGVLDDFGNVEWNEKFNKRIYDTRFKNKPCLECKILPLCNGGCSQHRIENEGIDYCMFNFDENHKLDIVKERFQTRIELSLPSDHGHLSINNLLNIDFNTYNKKTDDVFQESLDQLIFDNVKKQNLELISNINNLYINLIYKLRINQNEYYNVLNDELDKIIKDVVFDSNEQNVINLLSLPAVAYFYYRNKNYEMAITKTNKSILTDDIFLEKYPFLYAHKIQQLHNLMRINFRRNNVNDALLTCNNVLGHLISGKNIVHEFGFWKENYNLDKNDKGIIGMIYQIFSETVAIINNLSNNLSDEMDYLSLAFDNIFENKNTCKNLEIIFLFLKIKKDIFMFSKANFNEIEDLKDKIQKSEFSPMLLSLLKSIFSSVGINSYADNKLEFDRVYS